MDFKKNLGASRRDFLGLLDVDFKKKFRDFYAWIFKRNLEFQGLLDVDFKRI